MISDSLIDIRIEGYFNTNNGVLFYANENIHPHPNDTYETLKWIFNIIFLPSHFIKNDIQTRIIKYLIHIRNEWNWCIDFLEDYQHHFNFNHFNEEEQQEMKLQMEQILQQVIYKDIFFIILSFLSFICSFVVVFRF
jgi:hypothetical protein